MAILPDEREEEGGQVFAPCCQIGNGAGVEQGALVEDCKPRANLLSNLEDVGRDEDRLIRFNVSRKVILDKVLHDRIKVDQGLVDQRERRLMDERLREHQFLTGATGEVLAEYILFVGKIEEIEPPVRFRLNIRDFPDRRNEPRDTPSR